MAISKRKAIEDFFGLPSGADDDSLVESLSRAKDAGVGINVDYRDNFINTAIRGLADTAFSLAPGYAATGGVAGATGAALATGKDVQGAAALDIMGLSAAPTLAAGTAGASAAAGASAGETALFSTPTRIANVAAGETFSTAATTTLAGPTGTTLLSTQVPTSSLGLGSVAAGARVGAASQDIGASRAAAPGGVSTTDVLLASSLAAPVFSEAPADLSDFGRSDTKVEPRTSVVSREKDFETRRQLAGRAAAASGVTRNANEADLLGKVGLTTSRRRVGEARRILGY